MMNIESSLCDCELEHHLEDTLNSVGGGPISIKDFLTSFKKKWHYDLHQKQWELGYNNVIRFLKAFNIFNIEFSPSGYFIALACNNSIASGDMSAKSQRSPSNDIIKREPEEASSSRINKHELSPDSSLKSSIDTTFSSRSDPIILYKESSSRSYYSENEKWWDDSSITTPFIDTHCHLDKLYIEAGVELEDIANSENFRAKIHSKFEGAVSVLCYPNYYLPNNQHEEVKRFFGRLGNSSYVLGNAVGCHPKAIEYYDHENVTGFIKFLKDQNLLLAIGECGLDDTSLHDEEEQKIVFTEQVKLAKELDLPIVIHSRGHTNNDETLMTIKQGGLSRFHNIHRHCFTYSNEVAYKWLKEFNNVYFGLTAIICNTNCSPELLKFAAEFPLDHIVLETDAPFFNIKPDLSSHPGVALMVARKIAELRNMDVNEVLKVVYKNSKRLYSLDEKLNRS